MAAEVRELDGDFDWLLGPIENAVERFVFQVNDADFERFVFEFGGNAGGGRSFFNVARRSGGSVLRSSPERIRPPEAITAVAWKRYSSGFILPLSVMASGSFHQSLPFCQLRFRFWRATDEKVVHLREMSPELREPWIRPNTGWPRSGDCNPG